MKKLRVLRLNIKLRLYLFTFFLVLFSIAAISLITYFKSTFEQRERISENSRQIIEQLSFNLDSYFDDLARLSLAPAYNKQLLSILEEEPTAASTSLELLEKQRYIESFLDSMMVYPRKDILHAFLIADRTYYGSRYRPGFDGNISLEDLNLDGINSIPTEGTFFQGPYLNELPSSPADEVFSVYNVIRSSHSARDILAVVKVDADFSTIRSACSTISIGSDSGLILLDNTGKLAYSDMSGEVTSDLVAHRAEITQGSSIQLGGGTYLINGASIQRPGWTVYCVTSYEDMNEGAAGIRDLTLVAAFFLAGVMLLAIIVFLNRFLSPIYEIVDGIRKVGQGNFKVHFPDSRRDEMGMLGASMNEVTFQLDEIMKENAALENRVLQAQLVEKEAQVNMLYSQIQPHFIYNTLNMISMSVQLSQNKEAVLTINKLAKLMRSMSKSDSLHLLKAELELLCDYLDIQKGRYGGRLEYSLQVEPGLEQVEIPTLLLQPVAENAVVHGCESGRGGMKIKIDVTTQGEEVQILIKDNGPGIKPEELNGLRKRISEPPEKRLSASYHEGGTGLRNVNRRLKLRYGEAYGVYLKSEAGNGLTVRLTLPRKYGKGENMECIKS